MGKQLQFLGMLEDCQSNGSHRLMMCPDAPQYGVCEAKSSFHWN